MSLLLNDPRDGSTELCCTETRDDDSTEDRFSWDSVMLLRWLSLDVDMPLTAKDWRSDEFLPDKGAFTFEYLDSGPAVAVPFESLLDLPLGKGVMLDGGGPFAFIRVRGPELCEECEDELSSKLSFVSIVVDNGLGRRVSLRFVNL